MRLNKILIAIFVILLVAMFFRVRREHFTQARVTLQGIMAQVGVRTIEQLNAVIDYISLGPGAGAPPYPLNSPENALAGIIGQLPYEGEAAAAALQEVEGLKSARAATRSTTTGTPPFQARRPEFIQMPPQSTPMPGSQYYAAINNLITNNY
jgi:hypothetical protein